MRDRMENNQIIIYGVVICLALLVGNTGKGILFEEAIEPSIMIVMYAMFTQLPLLHGKVAFRNYRFMIALLIGNFIVVPLIVVGLLQFFDFSTTLAFGVCLVLLAPCIDYVIVFTKLGKGDEHLMLAATPLLVVTQFIMLPIYSWLLFGQEIAVLLQWLPFAKAFVLFIVLPLVIALITQLYLPKRVVAITAWLPVPLMALVLFTVISSQLALVKQDIEILIQVIPIYIAFLCIMPICAKLLGYGMKLGIKETRTLAFSMGTRNSLVVLPLAFALPPTIASSVAAVIVIQTMVELVGEILYIWLLPKWIGGVI